MAVTRHKGARAPDELTKLADLRARGVISEGEFQQSKAKVLQTTTEPAQR